LLFFFFFFRKFVLYSLVLRLCFFFVFCALSCVFYLRLCFGIFSGRFVVCGLVRGHRGRGFQEGIPWGYFTKGILQGVL
jgi:hypothetical protein